MGSQSSLTGRQALSSRAPAAAEETRGTRRGGTPARTTATAPSSGDSRGGDKPGGDKGACTDAWGGAGQTRLRPTIQRPLAKCHAAHAAWCCAVDRHWNTWDCDTQTDAHPRCHARAHSARGAHARTHTHAHARTHAGAAPSLDGRNVIGQVWRAGHCESRSAAQQQQRMAAPRRCRKLEQWPALTLYEHDKNVDQVVALPDPLNASLAASRLSARAQPAGFRAGGIAGEG
jgi:hypothetical protein